MTLRGIFQAINAIIKALAGLKLEKIEENSYFKKNFKVFFYQIK